MSFGAEMKDFLGAFKVGYQLRDKAKEQEFRRKNMEFIAGKYKTFQEMDEGRAREAAGMAGPDTPDYGGTPRATAQDAPSNDPVDTTLPPEARAFLNVIAGPESGGRYNVRYSPKGAVAFDPSSGQHPGVAEAGPEGPSTAAGRYQFTKQTWDRITGGKVPFTPENQDKYAWQLAQDDYRARTKRDLLADLKQGGVSVGILSSLSPTWTSFRGNITKQAQSTYNDSLNRYSQPAQAQPTVASAAPTAIPAAAPAAAAPATPAVQPRTAAENQQLNQAAGMTAAGDRDPYDPYATPDDEDQPGFAQGGPVRAAQDGGTMRVFTQPVAADPTAFVPRRVGQAPATPTSAIPVGSMGAGDRFRAMVAAQNLGTGQMGPGGTGTPATGTPAPPPAPGSRVPYSSAGMSFAPASGAFAKQGMPRGDTTGWTMANGVVYDANGNMVGTQMSRADAMNNRYRQYNSMPGSFLDPASRGQTGSMGRTVGGTGHLYAAGGAVEDDQQAIPTGQLVSATEYGRLDPGAGPIRESTAALWRLDAGAQKRAAQRLATRDEEYAKPVPTPPRRPADAGVAPTKGPNAGKKPTPQKSIAGGDTRTEDATEPQTDISGGDKRLASAAPVTSIVGGVHRGKGPPETPAPAAPTPVPAKPYQPGMSGPELAAAQSGQGPPPWDTGAQPTLPPTALPAARPPVPSAPSAPVPPPAPGMSGPELAAAQSGQGAPPYDVPGQPTLPAVPLPPGQQPGMAGPDLAAAQAQPGQPQAIMLPVRSPMVARPPVPPPPATQQPMLPLQDPMRARPPAAPQAIPTGPATPPDYPRTPTPPSMASQQRPVPTPSAPEVTRGPQAAADRTVGSTGFNEAVYGPKEAPEKPPRPVDKEPWIPSTAPEAARPALTEAWKAGLALTSKTTSQFGTDITKPEGRKKAFLAALEKARQAGASRFIIDAYADQFGVRLPQTAIGGRARNFAAGGAVPDDEDYYPTDTGAPPDQPMGAPAPAPAPAAAPAPGPAQAQPAQPLVPSGQKAQPAPSLVKPDEAKESTAAGMKWLNASMSPARTTAIGQDPAASSAQQKFDTNDHALTNKEYQAIAEKVDPENKLGAGQRYMKVQQDMFDFYMAHGDPEKAAAASASVLMYGRRVSQIMGQMAGVALDDNNPVAAARFMAKAYETLPDGKELRIDSQPDQSGGMHYQIVDQDTGNVEQDAVASLDDMRTMAKSMSSGIEWARQSFAVAQGTGMGSKMRGAGAGGLTYSQQNTQRKQDATNALADAAEAVKADPSDANKRTFDRMYRQAIGAGVSASSVNALKKNAGLDVPPSTAGERAKTQHTADIQKRVDTLNQQADAEKDPVKQADLRLSANFIPSDDAYEQNRRSIRGRAPGDSVDKVLANDPDTDSDDPTVKQRMDVVKSAATGIAEGNAITGSQAVKIARDALAGAPFSKRDDNRWVIGDNEPVFVTGEMMKNFLRFRSKPAAPAAAPAAGASTAAVPAGVMEALGGV